MNPRTYFTRRYWGSLRTVCREAVEMMKLNVKGKEREDLIRQMLIRHTHRIHQP